MTTHNGACNHGMTGECAACDYERATAMANLRIDLGNARAEIAQLRTERDAARADALALAAERNNWQSMYQDAMAERDEALKLLRELAISEITITPGVLHQYRCRACGWRWSGRPTDPQQHKDGCLAALKGEKNNGIS
jgi:rubrerythrin